MSRFYPAYCCLSATSVASVQYLPCVTVQLAASSKMYKNKWSNIYSCGDILSTKHARTRSTLREVGSELAPYRRSADFLAIFFSNAPVASRSLKLLSVHGLQQQGIVFPAAVERCCGSVLPTDTQRLWESVEQWAGPDAGLLHNDQRACCKVDLVRIFSGEKLQLLNSYLLADRQLFHFNTS